MKVKVIRKEDGEFLFVEANADFVNMLSNLQTLSIGSLAAIAANDNAFQVFSDSCNDLSDHLFTSPKKKTLGAFNDTPQSISELLSGGKKAAYPTATAITKNMDCDTNAPLGKIICIGKNNSSWSNGVALSNLGDSFEIAVSLPSGNPNLMLGILPDDNNLQSCVTSYNSYGFFLQLSNGCTTYPSGNNMTNIYRKHGSATGKELRMRFNHSKHTLDFSFNGDEWITAPNIHSYINEGTKCCPVLISYSRGPITVSLTPSPSSKRIGTFFKVESTFLVTNELFVSDSNSFSSHLQLLQKYQVSNVLALQTSNLIFTEVNLKKLIAAIFNGQRKVLEAAFDSDSDEVRSQAQVTNVSSSTRHPPETVDINMGRTDNGDVDNDGNSNNDNFPFGSSIADWPKGDY